MRSRWYYKKSPEDEIGPISFPGLRRMALEDIIDRETPVRKDGEEEWTTAGEIDGLFAPKRDRTIGPPSELL